MKIKRILSSALVIVMLITSIMTAIPFSAAAAAAERGAVSIKTTGILTKAEDIQPLIIGDDGYVNYNFTAAEAFEYELAKGYLDSVLYSSDARKLAVYVNRYTGLTYFFDSYGQLYTSNPTNPSYKGSSVDSAGSAGILSQLEIRYSNQNDITEVNMPFRSLEWLIEGATIKIAEHTEGNTKGLKVTYHLGESTDFFIAPGAAVMDDFHESFLQPLADLLENEILNALETIGETEFDPAFAEAERIWYANLKDENGIEIKDENNKKVRGNALTSLNFMELNNLRRSYKKNGEDVGTKAIDIALLSREVLGCYLDYLAAKLGSYESAEYLRVEEIVSKIKEAVVNYTAQIPEQWKAINPDNYDALCKQSSAFAQGEIVYYFDQYGTNPATLGKVRIVNSAMRALFPNEVGEDGEDKLFTSELIETIVRNAGFNVADFPLASFDISIIYTVNEKGELEISVPANSFEYDKSKYMLNSVTPLKFFGAADMSRDGYIFFPDGSGTVAEFDDFYFDASTNLNSIELTVKTAVYGQDFAYDAIDKAQKHRQQITMPVYGMVNTNDAGDLTGFFTILEDGSSLATIGYGSGKNSHKFAFAYASFATHPVDSFDLTESYSVSGLSRYTIGSKSTYVGNISYTVVPLYNGSAAQAGDVYYQPSYVGMANRYRDYLKDTGALSTLVDASKQLPLYIEAFGSIDVTKRILTFPVTVSEPLTKFEDIETMYNELSDAQNVLKAKAKSLRDEAAALDEKLTDEKASLEARAKEYDALAAKIVNIVNVNFRLTGFANGGMYFTYPSNAKWESKVGGKRGFNSLLEKTVSVANGTDTKANLGIYPDFDFVYINNTAMFDGISQNRDAARMIDNRFASKQVYNSISGEFESLFAMLANTGSLDKLYEKFNKKYSKYFEDFDVKTLSVSTLGSDLNSNFDEDGFIDRQSALGNVTSILAEMSESYSLMTDKGNIYALEYVDHILNAPIDSSHFAHSSYTVPFYGMVLHGYVSYTGTPLNYSGSPSYEILRAIENGASLYYILCYRTENLSYLKEDPNLSKYYGIDYKNWFDYVVNQYAILNGAIGELQDYTISNHEVLISERSISSEEREANNVILALEYVEAVDNCLSMTVDKAIKENGVGAAALKLNVDKAGLVAALCELIDAEGTTLPEYAAEALDAVIAEYETYYKNTDGTVDVAFGASDVAYESLYAFKTDSVATDSDSVYVSTDYTSDNGNVVRVTYTKGNEKVEFILNYNTYAVDVRLAAGEKPVTIQPYGFKKI
ncbi:MAG: hypothetical protein J6C09_02930 [Clostridia bacterium]|nr:hypothetical protein [Clostridia bacterium]